jgi:uncharacterized hydrophobic protein (TIGR00271 family)
VNDSKEEFLGELRLGRKLTTAGQTAAGGVAILLGLLFLVTQPLLTLSNALAPLAGLLAIILIGMTLASVIELLGGSSERGGTYTLVEGTIGGLISFLTGWSILAGSLVLVAALLRTIANRLLTMIPLGNLSPEILALLIFIPLTLIQLFQLFPKQVRLRTLVFPLIGLLLIAVLTMLPQVDLGVFRFAAPVPLSAINQSVGLLGISYAAFEALLISRRQIYDPGRHLPDAIIRTLLIGGAIFISTWFVIAGLNITTPPVGDLIVKNLYNSGIFPYPVLDVLALIALLLAANGSMMVAARQIHAFSLEGAFPQIFRRIVGPFLMPIALFAFLAGLVISLIILAPITWLVNLGSTMFLISMLVTNLTAIYSHRAEPERRRPFVVPFSPLVPGLAAAIIILLIGGMPGRTLLSALSWSIVGVVVYLAYARFHQVEAQEGEVVFGQVQIEEAGEARFRILLPIEKGEERYLTLQVAAALARQLNGEIIPLQVITVPDPLAIEEGRRIAQERNMLFRRSISLIGDVGTPVHPFTRLARTASEGIIDTAVETNCNLILMSWNVQQTGPGARIGPTLSQVTRESPCDMAVVAYKSTRMLKEGEDSSLLSNGNEKIDLEELQQEGATFLPRSVIVPTAGGPNAPLAIRLALLLAREHQASVTTIYIADENASREEIEDGNLRIRQTISAMREQAAELSKQTGEKLGSEDIPIKGHVIKSSNVVSGIAETGVDYDLMLLGATEESLIDQMLFGTIPEQVASESAIPVVIVKRYRGLPRLWLQRAWSALYDSLPTLSQEEQIEVYRSIHREARPDVDFFIMISLSALIATFGLLQSSTAVIIGAMLVAPLFSPILAMSLAIIQGNVRLLRLGIESTLKGIALAIGLALLIALLTPSKAVTPEISSRSLPTVFDLLVALASGSAGAYAVARKDVAAALPGVAIAAALVPPLGVVGIGLAMGDLAVAGGSILLFATNLIAIILAGGLTFLLLGFRPGAHGVRDVHLRRGLTTTIILLIIISVPLGAFFIRTIQGSRLNRVIQDNLVHQLKDVSRAQLVSRDSITITAQGNELLVTVPVYSHGQIPTSLPERLSEELSGVINKPVVVRLVVYTIVEPAPSTPRSP